MPLRMWYQDPISQGWIELDLTAQRISDLKLEVSYSHPARLSWTMYQPQHTRPIPDRAGVLFTDTSYGDFATPLFEGHVHEINPVASNEIAYVALDPTQRAGHEVTILSGPVVFPNVVPRLVYNVQIEQDDDYAFERAHDRTIGGILEDILTDPYATLVSLLAAPPLGTGGPAYDATDLAAMDLQPQEKIVFETEGLRAGIDRLLSYYPQYRLQFIPGHMQRKWRFRNVKQSPQLTLRLNDFSTGVKRVLSLDLQRSLDGRYTAIEILGPNQLTYALASVSGVGLTELWTANDEVQFLATGPGTPGTDDVARRWQIADTTKRQLGRLLPQQIAVQMTELIGGGLAYKFTRQPTLEASFDSGMSWRPINGFTMDVNRGIIVAPYHVFEQDGTGTYILPDDVRFQFSYLSTPLTARYPTSGFAGTAYTAVGIQLTFQRYDESLATGYEEHRLVTLATRLAQFQKLAQNLHQVYSDVIHAGGCVIEGLDYEFVRLDRRVNFTAVDQNGNNILTGWEAIDAILTDVEYDFSEKVTTLTFSSDLLEFGQANIEMLKEQLKIRAFDQRRFPGFILTYSGLGNFESTSTLVTSLNAEGG